LDPRQRDTITLGRANQSGRRRMAGDMVHFHTCLSLVFKLLVFRYKKRTLFPPQTCSNRTTVQTESSIDTFVLRSVLLRPLVLAEERQRLKTRRGVPTRKCKVPQILVMKSPNQVLDAGHVQKFLGRHPQNSPGERGE
jgi:hypothetical protein